MSVLFIYPSLDCPPRDESRDGLHSGVLKAAGHETRLLHVCEALWPPVHREEILRTVEEVPPGVIGFSGDEPAVRVVMRDGDAMRARSEIPL